MRWSATFDGDAQAVTVLGDTVYAGGHFDRACSTARTGTQGACVDGADDRVKLAALAVADGHLLDWTADANGVEGVLALASSAAAGHGRDGWRVHHRGRPHPEAVRPVQLGLFSRQHGGRISWARMRPPCPLGWQGSSET